MLLFTFFHTLMVFFTTLVQPFHTFIIPHLQVLHSDGTLHSSFRQACFQEPDLQRACVGIRWQEDEQEAQKLPGEWSVDAHVECVWMYMECGCA